MLNDTSVKICFLITFQKGKMIKIWKS